MIAPALGLGYHLSSPKAVVECRGEDAPGAEVGGPNFVKSILAPMPWTLIMPTGGVDATRDSIEEWFRAGVACIGIGSSLISKERLAAGDFAAISTKTSEVLQWIKEARGKVKG